MKPPLSAAPKQSRAGGFGGDGFIPPNHSLIGFGGGWLHPPQLAALAALAYRRLVDKDDRGQAGQCPKDPNDHTTNRNEKL
jgi:hypothetical protein